MSWIPRGSVPSNVLMFCTCLRLLFGSDYLDTECMSACGIYHFLLIMVHL